MSESVIGSEGRAAIWIAAIIAALFVGTALASRGCVQEHNRKVKIEFMPEDAAAVAGALSGLPK